MGSPPAGAPKEAGDWPSRFAQVLAETLAGARPAQQVVPWTTEEARRRLRRLGPQLSAYQRPSADRRADGAQRPWAAAGEARPGGGGRPLVRRVRSCHPADGVIEVAAVVSFGPQVRALAIRLERQPVQQGLERQPGRQAGAGHPAAAWRCTAIEAA